MDSHGFMQRVPARRLLFDGGYTIPKLHGHQSTGNMYKVCGTYLPTPALEISAS